MAEFARVQKTSETASTEEVADVESAPASSSSAEKLKSEIDAILDEIDGVLEQNAEEFVDGFRQRGGQ